MKPRMKSNTSSAVVIGVDIGKDIFHLVGFAADGKIAFRRRISATGSQGRLREAAAVHRRPCAERSANGMDRLLSQLGWPLRASSVEQEKQS